MVKRRKTRKPPNPYEQTIRSTLKRARRPLSTKQVAEKSGMGWVTAKKYLQRDYRRKVVKRSKRGNKVLWKK